LRLNELSSPTLNPTRERVLEALIELCAGDPGFALKILDLPPSAIDLLERNAELRDTATAPASSIYTGVLYAAMDLPSLSGADKRRANQRLVIASALFGLVRPADRIASYRLSGGASLPGVGKLSAFWRGPIEEAVRERLGKGLLVDMRSGAYVSLWPIPKDLARQAVTVKMWQEGPDGARTAVSHFNKESKGELARFLVTQANAPRSAAQLEELCRDELCPDTGWTATLDTSPTIPRLDIVLP